MNTIEKWIHSNKVREFLKEKGFQIKNVIPPVFESYAWIYHPYRIPVGQIIPKKDEIKLPQAELLKRINLLVENETGIPVLELPKCRYDIVKVVKHKLKAKGVSEELINIKISIIEKKAIKIALEPIQEAIDTIVDENSEKRVKTELKEISWQELYKYYGIEFNENSTWTTLGQKIKPENYIAGQEMPDMDYIPKVILNGVYNFLNNKAVKKVDLNSQSGFQSEGISIDSLNQRESINLIASTKREWIFINPRDFCRTIVAGQSSFINQIIDSELFEMSIIVSEE